jgi:cell division septum initiation protein DivIVA
MTGMGREPNNLRLHSPLETEPTFTLTFRGYNRREVDQYAQITETQLQAAIAERDELAARIRSLTDQLHQAHAELVELRRQPKVDDKISFRHLGPRVEQILAEAEREAEAIRKAAAESLAEERAAVVAERMKITDEFNRMVREYEESQQARRAQEEASIAKRLEAVRAEVSEGQAYARKVRAEAEELISQAQTEARQMLEEATAQAGQLKAEALADADAVREQAEQDAATICHSAEEYARETREEAEAHARQTRTTAEQRASQTLAAAEQRASQTIAAAEERASQTLAAAEQEATLLREQAEQYAAQVRAAAEKHVARLQTTGPRGERPSRSGLDGAVRPLAVPASAGTGRPGGRSPRVEQSLVDGHGSASVDGHSPSEVDGYASAGMDGRGPSGVDSEAVEPVAGPGPTDEPLDEPPLEVPTSPVPAPSAVVPGANRG